MAKGANPTVGTMAHPGQVDVRIAAKAADEATARALIAPMEAEICARLGDTVFGMDAESLEGAVAARLGDQGRTLALLEVGTGGLVSERLTSVPGMAGRLESLVTSLEGARRRLGVPSESAADLAEAVRLWADTDVGAALVMASPEDAGPNPVYPTRIGVATAKGASEAQHRPGGDLRQVRPPGGGPDAGRSSPRACRTCLTGSARRVARSVSVEEAIGRLRPGMRVLLPPGCGEPTPLIEEVLHQAGAPPSTHPHGWSSPGRASVLRPGARRATPVGDVPRHAGAARGVRPGPGGVRAASLLRRSVGLRAAPGRGRLTRSSSRRPRRDGAGQLSLGVSTSYPLPVARTAPLVIAEVNRRMPRTRGIARSPSTASPPGSRPTVRWCRTPRP